MTEPVVLDPADPLVLPVGHYMGAFHPDVGAPLKYRKLRIGMNIKKLTTEAEFGLWALSHGLPDRLDKTEWTRSTLLSVAKEMEVPEPEAALRELVARGALAEVTSQKRPSSSLVPTGSSR
jgi:hypothetical protein